MVEEKKLVAAGAFTVMKGRGLALLVSTTHLACLRLGLPDVVERADAALGLLCDQRERAHELRACITPLRADT